MKGYGEFLLIKGQIRIQEADGKESVIKVCLWTGTMMMVKGLA